MPANQAERVQQWALADVQQLGADADGAHAASWLPFLWGMTASDTGNMPEYSAFDATAMVTCMQQSGLVADSDLLQATLRSSGQQWDAPNCWPPLLCMWVDGLAERGGEAGAKLARRLSNAYLNAVRHGLQETGVAWEKYECSGAGKAGSGGEYEVQQGFGWTNGAVLHIIAHGLDAAANLGPPRKQM